MNKQELENIAKARQTKDRIVFTNGCFDILHVGHTRYLAQARDLGNFLVVGLNSDSSVKRLKGPKRPVVPQDERREMLLALKSVDAVVIFEEDTPKALIETIKPDILVKGGDWAIEQIVGAEFVQSYGGLVRSLAFHEGKSTTCVIEKILNL